jgi:hypothetical protein
MGREIMQKIRVNYWYQPNNIFGSIVVKIYASMVDRDKLTMSGKTFLHSVVAGWVATEQKYAYNFGIDDDNVEVVGGSFLDDI